MADDQNKTPKKAAHTNTPGSYEVGYSKPPVATRFKPGHSGNPRGRPKGAKNKCEPIQRQSLQDIILTEAYRTIKANEGDKQVSIPMATAVMRSIALNAAKGQTRSQKLFTDLLTKTEAQKRQEYEHNGEAVANYHMFWDQIFYEHRIKGLPLPNPAPHPDDVKFDTATGQIIFTGPTTESEKVKWENLSDRLQAFEESIAELEKLLADPKNEKIKYLIKDDIAFETNICSRLRASLKGWRKRK
jgi:hypothetical protein